METKGKRTVRASGPPGIAAEPGAPAENPAENPTVAPEIAAAEATPTPTDLTPPSSPPLETPVTIEVPVAAPATSAVVVSGPPAIVAQPPATVDGAGNAPIQQAVAAEFPVFGPEAFAALAESQAVLVRGMAALSAELVQLTGVDIDSAACSARRMLGATTLAEAFEINAGFACSRVHTFLDGSAKLSELGMKIAADATRPLLAEFGIPWIKTTSPDR